MTKRKRRNDTLCDALTYKYWIHRHSLFSLYDKGIKLDKESLYSVTPELIACHHAEKCRGEIILDAFCGAGGNSIQFAKVCKKVIAVDIDEEKIKLAKNNAKIYGVEQKIEFINGDFLKIIDILKNRDIDGVFMSPPWGGPDYLNHNIYDPENHLPENVGFSKLLEAAKNLSQNICLFLPKNTDISKLIELIDDTFDLESNSLNGKLKAISLYFGNWKKYI